MCPPFKTAIPLFSGFILFLILPLTRENSGILWKPQGFWISEGQAFTSEENENLIENRATYDLFRGIFLSIILFASDWILGGSSQPTVKFGCRRSFSDIFQGQTPSLYVSSVAMILLSGDCVLINLTSTSLLLQWIPNLSWLRKASPRKFHKRSWLEQGLGFVLLSNL